MWRRVLISYARALLLVIINFELLFAATSVLPVEDLLEKSNQTPLKAQRLRRQANSCSSIGLVKEENFWKQHNPNLTFQVTEVNSNDLVVVYAEQSLKSNVVWVLDYVNKVWNYIQTKTTYKEIDVGFGVCLAVIIHQGKYPGDQHMYSINKSNIVQKVNILDIGTLTPNLWTDESKRNEAADLLTNQLAYFVEYSSNLKLGSPSNYIWKSPLSQDSAWVEIFTYDAYMNVVELKESASRYKNETLSKWHATTFPKNETFWFRDWFLPIYENYGGTAVLKNYFNILDDNLPSSYYNLKSASKLTIGEFIHFWSGAAGADLAPLAWEAFGWTCKFQKELTEGQQTYKLKKSYTYEVMNETYNGTCSSESGSGIDEEVIDNATGEGDDTENTGVIIGVTVACVVIGFSIVSVIILVIYRRKKVRALEFDMVAIQSLTNEEVNEFFDGNPNVSKDEMMSHLPASPFIKDFEISKDRLVLGHENVRSSGEFGKGCVIRGFIRQLDSCELLPVVVKTVKPDVEVPQFKAILSEAKIMAYLGKHENIVLLCGTHTANIRESIEVTWEIYIALELCTLGNLQKYLKNNKKGFKINSFSQGNERTDGTIDTCSFSVQNLFKWSHEISNAMVYLTEKKVIHGDLAARNVLLTANRVAKVSGFGFSRQILNYERHLKTKTAPIYWQWMAIESMKKGEFSIASDVWAFGVTLWEIFSLGDTPYAEWTWDYGTADRLSGGDRLQAPSNTNVSVYELMQDCWKLFSSERPSFQTIYNSISNLVRKETETVGQNYIELDTN